MTFKRATRKQAYLRLMWVAPSGRGKSYGGLWLIHELATKVAAIDSERGSLSLYATPEGQPPATLTEIADGRGHWPFDVNELEDKTPQEYIDKVEIAGTSGYDGLLIDSASHSWMTAQSMVDQMGGWVKAGKSVSPLLARFQDKIMSYPGHVVVTYRSKVKSVIEPDDKGRNTIRKVGLEPVARGETEYDFTVCFESDERGMIEVTKTRCADLPLGFTFTRTDIPKIAAILKRWLTQGAPVSPFDALKFATDLGDLKRIASTLIPEHVKQHPEDRDQLLALYKARAAKLANETA